MPWGSARYAGLVLAFLVCTPTVGSAQISPLRQLSAILPSGEGKILVFEHCVACHGPALVQKRLEVGRGWPLNYWEDVILQMVFAWGATIESAEIAKIAEYLEASYSAAPSVPQAPLQTLPAGEEKVLFETKCLACHDREIIARRMAARRGLPASVWTKVLGRMSDYGARLNDAELLQLSAYLEGAMALRDRTTDENGLKAFSAALPDREGKSIVLAVCLSCHGPGELGRRVESFSGDDPYYWERVIKRMQSRWQAPLEDGDVEVTVKYLNSLAAE